MAAVFAPAFLNRIKPPVFADRQYPVTDFGAVGDGETLCSNAIAAAMRACGQAGGGSVIVPKGRFLTGAIH